MTTVRFKDEELDFEFRFFELEELKEKTGKDVDKLGEIVKDTKNVVLLASIGCKKSEDEIKELIKKDGTFNCITGIVNAFNKEIGEYFGPNSLTPANSQ